jgi:hypothetical protein
MPLGTLEAVENAGAVVLGNADPLVLHSQLSRLPVRAQQNDDRLSGTKLDRVGQEIFGDLLDCEPIQDADNALLQICL